MFNWILRLFHRKKIKELKETTRDVLVTKQSNVDLETLIKELGGKENIINSTATINTLTIYLKNKNLVNKQGVKNIINATIISLPKGIKIASGNISKNLSELINKKAGN